jgi:hypothetical protein
VIRDIRAGAAGLEPFHALTDLVPVVMLLDPFFFANGPQIRDIVNKELEELGITPFDYQVLYVGQFENDLPLIKRLGLARLLREKMAETEDIVNGGAYVDFERYLARVARDRHRERPRLLTGEWEALMAGFQTDPEPGSSVGPE